MKHWSVKLIALVLVAVCGFSLAVCGTSVIFNVNMDMYGGVTLEQRQNELMADELEYYGHRAGYLIAAQYMLEKNTQEGTTVRDLWRQNFDSYTYAEALWPECEYRIYDSAGLLLEDGAKEHVYVKNLFVDVYAQNGAVTRLGFANKDFPEYEDLPVGYVWTDYQGNELPGLDERTVHYHIEQVGQVLYRIERFDDEPLRVEILLTEADMSVLRSQTGVAALMQVFYTTKEFDIPVSIGSTLYAVSVLRQRQEDRWRSGTPGPEPDAPGPVRLCCRCGRHLYLCRRSVLLPAVRMGPEQCGKHSDLAGPVRWLRCNPGPDRHPVPHGSVCPGKNGRRCLV